MNLPSIHDDPSQLIDDEPIDASNDTGGSAEERAAEARAFEERLNGPRDKGEVTRHLEREAAAAEVPAAPVAPPPPPAPSPTETAMLEILRELKEQRAPREPVRETPPPTPEPTYTERFTTDRAFYAAAMRQAGFTPNAEGHYTLEAEQAVRAHLRNAELEAQITALREETSRREMQRSTLDVAEQIEARLASFEPATETQQEILGHYVGSLISRGVRPSAAIEQAFREMAPIFRAKGAGVTATPAPTARQAPQALRAPVTAADKIIAAPGMGRPRAARGTPAQQLAASRRGLFTPRS